MKKFSCMLALMLALVTLLSGALATTITVYNSYDYIDESVLDEFTAETGIEVEYVMFTRQEEMYTQITTGGGKYDIIFPSDYIIERLIKDDMLAEIDYDKCPNARENLLDKMWESDYDMGNVYSVPYMWGTMGILYNTEMVGDEVYSWDSLFDPQYRRDVLMLDSMRDMMGLMLVYLGYDINSTNEDELAEVRDLLLEQKSNNIVQGYLVDEVKDKMVGGEAAMAVMWSGDAMYAMDLDEDGVLAYVVPEEGSNIWIDAMCVLKDSENYDAAMMFIDFLCREDIAARNYDYIHYASPIKQVVENLPEEEAANVAVNPDEEVIERCYFFHDLMDSMDIYNTYWMQIRS